MDQGDPALLDEPAAQQLLRSTNPARFGYTWRDGSPRVVAMWFEWSGGRVVMGTPAKAPKLKVLQDRSRVAVTIDDAGTFPYRELMIRDTGLGRPAGLRDAVPERAGLTDQLDSLESAGADCTDVDADVVCVSAHWSRPTAEAPTIATIPTPSTSAERARRTTDRMPSRSPGFDLVDAPISDLSVALSNQPRRGDDERAMSAR